MPCDHVCHQRSFGSIRDSMPGIAAMKDLSLHHLKNIVIKLSTGPVRPVAPVDRYFLLEAPLLSIERLSL